MAIDHALLDLAAARGAAFLRLYSWKPFCLSFGRHEPARRRYGLARTTELGIDCVRRPTGGRAVWHARELTYAMAAPAALGPLPTAYRAIHRLLLAAIRRLGVDASLAPAPSHHPGPGAGACFAAPVGGEIVAGGKKVAGSAQVREGGGFLQHGSLLLEDDQDLVHRLVGREAGPAPEAPLAALLGRSIDFAEVAAAVVEEARGWARELRRADAGEVLALADHRTAHYRSEAWTWER
jgi:lipoate-protein ligase A